MKGTYQAAEVLQKEIHYIFLTDHLFRFQLVEMKCLPAIKLFTDWIVCSGSNTLAQEAFQENLKYMIFYLCFDIVKEWLAIGSLKVLPFSIFPFLMTRINCSDKSYRNLVILQSKVKFFDYTMLLILF